MYDEIEDFNEGLAKVKKYENRKIIDELRNEILGRPTYDFGKNFEELCKLKYSEKIGFIDKLGKEIIECKYDNVYSLSEQLTCVVLDGKIGLVGKNGNSISDCVYEEIGCFSEGLARVKLNGKYGFIDRNGIIVIGCIWFYAQSFSDGLSRVRFFDESELFQRTGQKPISTISKDYLFDFRSFTLITENNGFIDKEGSLKINCIKYTRADRFVDGLAVVEQQDVSNHFVDFGLIDKSGNEVVECKYSKKKAIIINNTSIIEEYLKNGLKSLERFM